MLFSSLMWKMLSALLHPHIRRHVGRVFVLSAHICNVKWQGRISHGLCWPDRRLRVAEMCLGKLKAVVGSL